MFIYNGRLIIHEHVLRYIIVYAIVYYSYIKTITTIIYNNITINYKHNKDNQRLLSGSG